MPCRAPSCAATWSHAAGAEPSTRDAPRVHARVVKKCRANGSSARHTSAGPAAVECHANGAGTGGSIIAFVSTIIGLGLDATDIPRIAATLERYGSRFMQRVFTEGEIAYCLRRREPAIHFAGRFAAKEAAMKALGTGHTPEVLWRDVEVVRRGGPPQLLFHRGAGRRFAAVGAASLLLTITHSQTLALAEVLLLTQ